MNKKMLITLILVMITIAGLCYADTLLVPSQYPTIQAGINAAVSGDTVLVADGTYTGEGNKNLNFAGRAIVVTSENGPENCIIDCEDSGRGFHFHSAEYHDSVVSGFTIINGQTGGNGGGIFCDGVSSYPYDTSPTICNNIISGNSATLMGGGIYCKFSYAIITGNIICGNSAGQDGSGIFCSSYMSPTITGNTIVSNSGSGIYGLFSANPVLTNCILWGNSPDIYQYSANIQANYCDIGQNWPGVGNIQLYPRFVCPTQHDYRLQWGSPCIDSGDPNPAYNDPDGTRADMGAFFYDQSIPVRILLTPHDMPIEIPPEGGSFDYTIQVTNIDPLSLNVDAWCDVTLPNGSIFGPTLGPVNIEVGSEVTIGRERTQDVPTGAPVGMYSYNAYATAGTDTSTDSFTFVKRGTDGLDGLAGWFNTGESFEELLTKDVTIPKVYSLEQNYPNPFNPFTTLSYALPEAAKVTLNIYDISGRSVTTFVDGWREAGSHEVTFDGSNLASGVYVYRMQAGDFTASGKMVLIR